MKRILKTFIVLCLVLSTVFFIPAKADLENSSIKDTVLAPKEELIYIKLDETGKALKAYVVNAFTLSSAGWITDYGDYDTVKNLSAAEDMSFTGDNVKANAPEGRFYYQGNLKEIVLPWTIDISYLLNGDRISPKEMPGKAGEAKIIVKVKTNPDADEKGKYFAKKYALQITVTLDADLCTDIKAENATIASAGKNKLVSFNKLPDTDADFSVSLKTDAFEMAGIQFAGVPIKMDLQFDTDELADGFSDFSKGTKELNKGAEKLRDGADDLHKGTQEFLEGISKIKAGMDELVKGLDGLKKGNDALVEGSSQIYDAINLFNEKLSGIDLTAADLSPLAEGSAAIYAAIEGLADGLKALQSALENAENMGLFAANENAIAQMSQQIAFLQLDPEANAAQIAHLTEMIGLISANNELLKGVQTGISGDGTLTNPGLAAGAGALKDEYAQFDQAINALPLMVSDLLEGFMELKNGIEQLSLHYQEFHGGLDQSAAGTADLLNGLEEITNGVYQLADGAEDIDGGAAALYSGMKELSKGTGQFAEETGSIKTQIEEKIDEILSPYQMSEDEEIPSFINSKNTNISNVQFIMSTDSIEIQKLEEPAETEVEKNFWQRFLALFGL